MFLSEEGPTLETLDLAFFISNKPTFYIFQFVSKKIKSTLEFWKAFKLFIFLTFRNSVKMLDEHNAEKNLLKFDH